jgi:hypothetical protein
LRDRRRPKHWAGCVVENNGRRLHVDPGTVMFRANLDLKPYGYRVGPDPASSVVYHRWCHCKQYEADAKRASNWFATESITNVVGEIAAFRFGCEEFIVLFRRKIEVSIPHRGIANSPAPQFTLLILYSKRTQALG